jgi:hypothetical protein
VRIFASQKPGFSGVPALARPLRAPAIPCAPGASENGLILEPAQGTIIFFSPAVYFTYQINEVNNEKIRKPDGGFSFFWCFDDYGMRNEAPGRK